MDIRIHARPAPCLLANVDQFGLSFTRYPTVLALHRAMTWNPTTGGIRRILTEPVVH